MKGTPQAGPFMVVLAFATPGELDAALAYLAEPSAPVAIKSGHVTVGPNAFELWPEIDAARAAAHRAGLD